MHKKITRRGFMKSVGAIGGAAMIGALSGFPTAKKSFAQVKEPIKLGFVIGLTGIYGTETGEMVKGATLAVEEFNAKGGVLGRKVELLVRDDKLKIEEAAKRGKELLEKEKVDFMFGGMNNMLVLNEECKHNKTIFVGCTKSNEITQAPDVSPYTFGEALNLHIVTQCEGPWIFKNLGKKWFILAADYPFGWQITDGLRAVGKALGYTEVGMIKYPLGTTDYTSYFPKILAAEPDVLLLTNFGKDQLNSVKQLDEFGMKKKMKIFYPILLMSARLGAGDEAFEGVNGGTGFYWELEKTIPTAKMFVTKYKERWGIPPIDYAAYAYSGIRTILSAVERAGTVEAKKVILKIEGYEYDYYKGKQWYRPWDHRSMQDVFIVRSKGAKERTGEWDVFQILETVKAKDNQERSAEQLGLKEGVPLSKLL
jgi:branched-chain amino acid transport system substrate-binding protein